MPSTQPNPDDSAPPRLVLQPTRGPGRPDVVLDQAGRFALGRDRSCEVRLEHEAVSKRHATIEWRAGRWWLADAASRHGTHLNSVRLASGSEAPLCDGDAVRVPPWTFRVRIGGTPTISSCRAAEDPPGSTIRDFGARALEPVRSRDAEAIARGATALAIADSEASLIATLLDQLLLATGMTRGAALRQGPAPDELEVLDVRPSEPQRFRFSRTLVATAAQGRAARLSSMPTAMAAVSVVELELLEALCVPVMNESGPAFLVYLDARRDETAPIESAEAVCVAMAQVAAAALQRIAARSVRDRLLVLEHDLVVAAQVQARLLPPPSGIVGPARYDYRFLPGRSLSGDLFDIVAPDRTRAAFWLGDVAGKGAGASVLMASVQATIRGAIGRGDGIARAVAEANREMARLTGGARFVTLFLAELDADARTLSVIDAGHGLAAIIDAESRVEALRADGGPPLGVDAGHEYGVTRLPFDPRARIVVFSDGFVDQPIGPLGTLGLQGILDLLRNTEEARLLDGACECLRNHAAAWGQRDDATIARITLADGAPV